VVAASFNDSATLHALQQLIQVGTSAGGIRPKAVVGFNPVTGQVRSGHLEPPEGFEHWLIKLDGVDEAGLLGVESFASNGHGRIEYAYSLMAADCGVDMMPCRLLVENDRAHFMTRRFDRPDPGEKVHVQTLCALDHLDYRMNDTHSYAQYLDVIDRLGLGAESREQAFRRVVFNVAGVNRDDHTKNMAFCCSSDGRWSLAPAYDVSYAFNPGGRWTQRHQMSVNGKFEAIDRTDLLELADRFAVPAAKSVVADVLRSTGRWPVFAEEAGVDGERLRKIEASLRELRPS
jgi:serine/threonine-protein kinase HipA